MATPDNTPMMTTAISSSTRVKPVGAGRFQLHRRCACGNWGLCKPVWDPGPWIGMDADVLAPGTDVDVLGPGSLRPALARLVLVRLAALARLGRVEVNPDDWGW